MSEFRELNDDLVPKSKEKDEVLETLKSIQTLLEKDVVVNIPAPQVTVNTPETVKLDDKQVKAMSKKSVFNGGGGSNGFVRNEQGTAVNPATEEKQDDTIALMETGVAVQMADSASVDAFGRARVSQTDQRFDSEFIYDKQPLLFDEILVGTGTSTHNATGRDITLKNGSVVDGDGAKMVQKWHNPYTPGNSQLIDVTGALNAANISGGTASIFLRNNSSDTVYDQADWNGENVDDVNWEFSQIFQMDFQSLKTGRVRFNLVRNGLVIKIHEINNDNIRTGGYWQYPAQPIQWNIYNTATETVMEIGYFCDGNGIGFRYTVPINAGAEVRAICSTVKSEGGGHVFDMAGFQFVADNNVTPVTVGTTLVPIITIRVKSTFNSLVNDAIALPQGFGISTNNPIKYVLLLDATLTGATFNDVNANSMMEFDVAATALAGGTDVDSDYVSTVKNRSAGKEGLLGRTIMANGENGTPTTLTLAAIRTSTSDGATLGVIKWKEIR